jgi:ATP phosphoribosyltransferase
VRDGSVEFGITGIDVIEERKGENGSVLMLHDSLGFGQCYLNLAVPKAGKMCKMWKTCAAMPANSKRPLRVVTKYPFLTGRFLEKAESRTR